MTAFDAAISPFPKAENQDFRRSCIIEEITHIEC